MEDRKILAQGDTDSPPRQYLKKCFNVIFQICSSIFLWTDLNKIDSEQFIDLNSYILIWHLYFTDLNNYRCNLDIHVLIKF